MINGALKITLLMTGLLAFSRVARADCTGYDCYGNPVETSVIGQRVCGPNQSTWVCEQAGSYFGFADTGAECSCGAPECPADQVFDPDYGCMCLDGGPLDQYGDCATGSSSSSQSTIGGTIPWTWTVAGGAGSGTSSSVGGTLPWTWLNVSGGGSSANSVGGTVTWTDVNASGQTTGPYTAVGGTVSCTDVIAAGGSCY